MAYFEMQGHPAHSWERGNSSLLLLDNLIRLFSLTTLDSNSPDSQYSLFETYENSGAYCPSSDPPEMFTSHPELDSAFQGVTSRDPCPQLKTPLSDAKCACDRFTLKEQWPTVSQIAPFLAGTTMWPNGLSEGENRKEEGRRLVWSSVMLSAGRNSFVCAEAQYDPELLFFKDYHNVGIPQIN